MMAKDLVAVERRALTPTQFGDLADVPPELEWLPNITDPKTGRAYKNDVGEFSVFTGLSRPAEHRTIVCPCDCLAQTPQVARTRPASIRHHDAAGDRVHSSLYAPRVTPRLCEDPPLWLPG